MKFELLKQEDIEGEKMLDIFKQISPVAFETELVSKLSGKDGENECPYWLDGYEMKYPDPTNTVEVLRKFSEPIYHIVNKYGKIDSLKPDNQMVGVRLKVSYNEIKDEIIRVWDETTQKNKPYISDVENGVKVFLALEWPQQFVISKQKNEELDMLQKYGLKKCDKEFYNGPFEKLSTIKYNDNRYARIGDDWVRVTPIEWYYDENRKVLVSKKVLFLCSMNKMVYDYPMEKSFPKFDYREFLHDKFEKVAMMDRFERSLYLFQGESEECIKELDEIKFWEKYQEDRAKRKEVLEKIKAQLLLPKELSENIENILKQNKEDEELVKEFAMPKYISSKI